MQSRVFHNRGTRRKAVKSSIETPIEAISSQIDEPTQTPDASKQQISWLGHAIKQIVRIFRIVNKSVEHLLHFLEDIAKKVAEAVAAILKVIIATAKMLLALIEMAFKVFVRYVSHVGFGAFADDNANSEEVCHFLLTIDNDKLESALITYIEGIGHQRCLTNGAFVSMRKKLAFLGSHLKKLARQLDGLGDYLIEESPDYDLFESGLDSGIEDARAMVNELQTE